MHQLWTMVVLVTARIVEEVYWEVSTVEVEEGAKMLTKDTNRKPTVTAASNKMYWIRTLTHLVDQLTCWFYQMI